MIQTLSTLSISLLLLTFSFFVKGNVSAQESSPDKPKLGLVLSGGGAKGLAHIGVLKVLEDADIRVDMLGGTSMGSIVGGLYAMGYSAYEIEDMVLKQDWVHLLTDKIYRNSLSVTEKEDFDKFIVNFPFENMKFKLPAGLGAGQNISMMLSNRALPVAEITDFSKLPIPFLCVATDIVNGKEIVLKSGYLPDAIQASMAIPTLFTPVEIDNNLLVDGGLVNNFPVDRVKEMGADFVIGVNLGLKEYTKKELKNLAAVLEQSIFFHAKERNKKNQKLCDILISPDVYSSNASSFTDAAELIKIGEKAALDMLPEIQGLWDSLLTLGNVREKIIVERPDTVFIEKIEYFGLDYVSESFLQGKLRINYPSNVTIHEIENGIERAYGTLFFDKITYKLVNLKNGNTKLLILADESKADMFRLGVRYDNLFRSQLLLNATFRNKLIKGSKFSVDVLLGEFPKFSMEYKIHTGWKPRKNYVLGTTFGILPDFGIRVNARGFDVYQYENSSQVATYNYTYLDAKLYASNNISNSAYLEGGLSGYITHVDSKVAQESSRIDNQFIVAMALLKIDTKNKRSFYNKGTYMETSFESFYDMNFNEYVFNPFQRGIFKIEKALPVSEKMAFIPKFTTGFTIGDSIPVESRFYLGGSDIFNTPYTGIIPFNGLQFMEEWNYSTVVLALTYQYEFLKNHFILLDCNIGKTSRSWENLFFNYENLLGGYGFTYGYSSFVGPIKLGFHKASYNSNDWIGSINIGLLF